MKQIFIKLLLCFCCLCSFNNTSFASWQGPVEILRGGWGKDPGMFGIELGESGGRLPSGFCVTVNGYIVVSDDLNARIQVFKQDGSIFSVFSAKNIADDDWKLGWPLALSCFSNAIYTEFGNYTQIYDFNGGLKYSSDNMPSGLVGVLPDDNFVTSNNINRKNYYKYSSAGLLLQTYTGKPLELGVERSSNKLLDGRYRTVIQYNDTIFSITAPDKVEYFTRDYSRNLYAVVRVGSTDNMNYRVYKYSKCGKTFGSVDLPADSIIEEPDTIPPRPTPLITVLAQYGKPVIAPNGDVYTWKRTPDTYSILKWTWVDDPNVATGPDAPTNLAVAASTTGLYLTWSASPNDPGCVTGYEIAQATTSGGVYSTITTVNAGTLKYNDASANAGTTYYYKVRAMSGSDYSLYTSEVSGKR